jgi:hypothetical protein
MSWCACRAVRGSKWTQQQLRGFLKSLRVYHHDTVRPYLSSEQMQRLSRIDFS